jgi:hypothetical protein
VPEHIEVDEQQHHPVGLVAVRPQTSTTFTTPARASRMVPIPIVRMPTNMRVTSRELVTSMRGLFSWDADSAQTIAKPDSWHGMPEYYLVNGLALTPDKNYIVFYFGIFVLPAPFFERTRFG